SIGAQSRFDRHNAPDGGKPQAAIATFPTGWFGDAVALDTDETITLAKSGAADDFGHAAIKIVQFFLADSKDAFAAAHPKIAEIVLHDFIDLVAAKTIVGAVMA